MYICIGGGGGMSQSMGRNREIPYMYVYEVDWKILRHAISLHIATPT
jgi:hypothetical protein